MMINISTSSLNYNYWLKRLDTVSKCGNIIKVVIDLINE